MERLLSFLRWDPPDLLAFEDVRQQLRLGRKDYRGIQHIPLDKIVGSIARYDDFTRTFLPRRDALAKRWERVDLLALEGRLPPIEVYQVDEVYFVRDGNHRVSVARQAGASTIEAHVWEYPSRVPLSPDDSTTDVLIRQAYLDFLERTQLDRTRPGQRIVFTALGRYRLLEVQIALYRHHLEHTQGRTLTLAEAAADWYDTVYKPMADYIHHERILQLFPGRTEADLIGWLLEYREWLQERYGQEVDLKTALATFKRQHYNVFQRFYAWAARRLGWPVFQDRRSR
jgi:hypothetical protein